LLRLKKKTPEERLESLKKEVTVLLTDDSQRMKYSRTLLWEKKKDIIHWGQRKLFISEVWFLTKYGHLGKHVVYAGSAPGTHIPFLAQLFPEHHFILVDPSNFDLKELTNDRTNAMERIKTMQEYFTDELAAQLGNEHQDILFISDIRTADPYQLDREKVEIMVKKDNEKQRDWVHILKAKKSLLKFRCPYPDRKTGKENLKMLKGEIYIQPYASPTSTETRLIPDDSLEEVEYDNVKYEEQLYYHNHFTRKEKYNQPIHGGEGLDNSWDVSAEVVILYDFLVKFPQYYSDEKDMFEKISQMSKDISRNITFTSRSLSTPMVPPEKRRYFAHKDHTKFYPELEADR